MQQFEERHGVRIIQAWGMTETSPLGSVARPPAGRTARRSTGATAPRPGRPVGARRGPPHARRRRGGARGTASPPASSRCAARGSRARTTSDDASEEKFDDGWLRTGDIAAIDERGYIIISDRAKDVIKSGGEWISSVELENEIMAHPAVREAAVIAMPRRALGRAPAGLRRARGGRRAHARGAARAPRPAGGEVVAPGRARDRRRGAEDQRREVRQEGAAPAARGGPAQGP